jgi:hypothetical protein
MKDLAIDITGGSSGYGMSYYSTAAKCSLRAYLGKLAEAAGEEVSPSGKAARVGIYFHSLAELFYRGDFSAKKVLQATALQPEFAEDLEEAKRFWKTYSNAFGERDFWGTPVTVERRIPDDTDEGLERRERAKIQAAFGLDPAQQLTARLDLVARISDEQIDRIGQRTGLVLTEPGIYIVDHKTTSRKDSTAAFKYDLSPQFTAYQMLWDALHPDEPCKGMIANVVIGYKTMEKMDIDKWHTPVLVSAPSEKKRTDFMNWFDGVLESLETPRPNWTACVNWGVCPHYLNGDCRNG